MNSTPRLVLIGSIFLASCVVPDVGLALSVENTSTISTRSVSDVSPQERFEILHKSLKDILDEYTNDVLRSIAYLLLAIGWIVTSDRSREFLRGNKRAYRVAIIIVLLIALLHTGLAYWTFDRSQRMSDLLVELNYLPHDYYSHLKITPIIFVGNLTLHLGLFATLFFLLVALRSPRLKKIKD